MTPEEREIKALVVRLTIDRLEQTYSDYILSVPGYDQIPTFFREHLYNPPNKEARDAALDSLYVKLKSVTGPEMTESIHKLIVLNKLTDELDLDTARVMIKGPLKKKKPHDLGIDDLNQCMADAGRFDDRKSQIDMVGESLTFFFSLSKLPLIRLVMAPIKVAASLVGAMELVKTMEAGYNLSSRIKDMRPFVEAFREREGGMLEAFAAKAKR